MQNVQMVQWRWELEVPFATATTMRGEETVLIRTSFHPFIPSVFQPSYIVLQIATSLNILFTMSINSTTMCLRAKRKVKFTLRNPPFATKPTIHIKTQENGFPLTGSRNSWDLPPRNTSVLSQDIQNIMGFGCCPITCLEAKEKRSSPSDNKNCYSNQFSDPSENN